MIKLQTQLSENELAESPILISPKSTSLEHLLFSPLDSAWIPSSPASCTSQTEVKNSSFPTTFHQSECGSIAIFDSGVGGLSVVKEIAKQLPNERITYYSDAKNFPYGEKKPEQLRGFCLAIVKFLMQTDHIKAVIIACNTATAAALEFLQRMINIPVVGMITPGAAAAAAVTGPGQKVGIVATESTIKSGAYEVALRSLRKDLVLVPHAAPKLAPLVERSSVIGAPEIETIAEQVAIFKLEKVNTLILGCTHYPHIAQQIQLLVGADVQLINPAVTVVEHLKQLLSCLCLLRVSTPSTTTTVSQSAHTFWTSGSVEQFEATANKWLSTPVRAQFHSANNNEV